MESGAVTLEREFRQTLTTGLTRSVKPISEIPDIVSLRSIYASVELKTVRCVATQATLATTDTEQVGLILSGNVWFGLVPTGRNSEIHSGGKTTTILDVRRKELLPLSSTAQNTVEKAISLEGYETDLAADPRRQQGPVFWATHTGIRAVGKEVLDVCHLHWTVVLECSGKSTLW